MNQSSVALNALSPAEQATGWQLLFDGNSLKGWVGAHGEPVPGNVWTIEDGTLALEHPLDGFGSIYTERSYNNFDLKLEWKISPAGNSGVKYLLKQRPDPDWFIAFKPPMLMTLFTLIPAVLIAIMVGRRFSIFKRRTPFRAGIITAAVLALIGMIGMYGMKTAWSWRVALVGYEYQIADDQTAQDVRGLPTHSTASVYDLIAPTNKHMFPVGQFNESEIIVNGNHVEHWLNGYKTAEFDLGSPRMSELLRNSKFRNIPDMNQKVVSPIMLQNHTTRVWFRNIRIRTL